MESFTTNLRTGHPIRQSPRSREQVPSGSDRVLDAGTQACDAGFMAKLDSETRIPPRLVVGLVLSLLIVVFIAENNRRTKMRFLLPEVTAPLWTALFVAALLGGITGALIARHFSTAETQRRHKKSPRSDKPPQ
jgi:uncharacterized integral membrane protein